MNHTQRHAVSVLLGTLILGSSLNSVADPQAQDSATMMYGGGMGMMAGGYYRHPMMGGRYDSDSGACPNQGNMAGGMMGGMMGGNAMGMMEGRHERMNLIHMLELDSAQRQKLRELRRELRKQHWASKGQIMDEQEKLIDLYDQEVRDPKAIDEAYGKIFTLKRRMIEANVVAGNKARELLTEEQRQQLTSLERYRGKRYMGGMMMQ